MGVVFAEMLSFGQGLSKSIVETAQALAGALTDEGLDVVGKERGFTRSHMLLLNTTPQGSAPNFRRKMEDIGIFTTAVDLWSEDGKPRTGLRIGTNDIARLGYAGESINRLASLLADVVLDRRDEADIRNAVKALAKCHAEIDVKFQLENLTMA
jgi:glycine hydroxymethyltransferase